MFENIKRFFIPRRVEIQEGKDEKDKIRNQEEKQNKNKTIEEIAVAAGIPYEKAYEEVMELKKLHGISEKQYLRNELWKLEGSDYARKITNIKKKNLERKAYNDKITSCTNLSKKDIRDDIKKLNSKEIYRVTLKSYNKYELYKLKEEEQIAVLKLLAEIASMKKRAAYS